MGGGKRHHTNQKNEIVVTNNTIKNGDKFDITKTGIKNAKI
jgi:hypothetical protein